MKHRSSQILFAHWDAKRGRRALPERSAIDPAEIRAGLSDTFILSFNRFRGHPFRLAGTRVCALSGTELKERSFVGLWESTQQPEIVRLLDQVADESVGIVAGGSARADNGETIELELLLLPLHHWGRSHARLIGTLGPLVVPYWFGTRSIGPLSIGDYRYVGLRPASTRAVVPFLGNPVANRRRLVVYDGGYDGSKA